MITQKQLKQLIHYNPDTGVMYWRVKRNGVRPDGVLGAIENQGYVRTTLLGDRYQVHRLIWLYTTGEWPDQIDHINGIRHDNRWCNLREVTSSVNSRNKKKYTSNVSGVPGVRWVPKLGKYVVDISVDKCRKHLGCHDDFFEAVCVRKSAEVRGQYHINHGRQL